MTHCGRQLGLTKLCKRLNSATVWTKVANSPLFSGPKRNTRLDFSVISVLFKMKLQDNNSSTLFPVFAS